MVNSGRTLRGSHRSPGFSQLELLVGMAVLMIVFLIGIKVFTSSTRGLFHTQAADAGRALAEERMNDLASRDFLGLVISRTKEAVPGVTPAVYHDPVNYPPQTRTEGQATVTSYAYVEMVGVGAGGALEYKDTYADYIFTVPRRVVVTAVWSQGGSSRQSRVEKLLASPISSSSFLGLTLVQGVVRSTEGVPLRGVKCLYDSPSDEQGRYKVGGRLMGTFEKAGYEPLTVNLSGEPSLWGVVTKDVELRRYSARLTGALWANDRLVITEVAARILHPTTGVSQEYVRLFNPTVTTYTIRSPDNVLYFGSRIPADPNRNKIDCVYVNTTLYPGRYYLFASHPTIQGPWGARTADAYWSPASANNAAYFPDFANLNIIPSPPAPGSLVLFNGTAGFIHDTVGWQGAGPVNPAALEGSPIPDSAPLADGQAYCRLSSTAGVNAAYAPVYDFDNNASDWALAAPDPRTTAHTATVISGRVSSHTFITAMKQEPGGGTTSGFHHCSTVTVVQPNGGRPYATYTLDLPGNFIYNFLTYGPGASSLTYGPGSCNSRYPFGLTFKTTFNPDEVRTVNIINRCGEVPWSAPWYMFTGRVTTPTGQPADGVTLSYMHTDGDGRYLSYSVGGTINSYPEVPFYGQFTTSVAGTIGQLTAANFVIPDMAVYQISAEMEDGNPPPFQVNATYFRDYSRSAFLVPVGHISVPVNTAMVCTLDIAGDALDLELERQYRLESPTLTLFPGVGDAGKVIPRTVRVLRRTSGIAGTLRAGGQALDHAAMVVALTRALGPAEVPPTPQTEAVYSATSDANGRYAISLPAGSYHVYVWRATPRENDVLLDRKDGQVTVGEGLATLNFDW